MQITSTKLAQKTVASKTQDQPLSGVIVAVPETKFSHWVPGSQNTTGVAMPGRLPEGIYVFPAQPGAKDPLNAVIAGLAKTLSVQLASSIHPHLGTGVRAGWVVFGAISLFDRVSSGGIPWHEVAVEGGELAVEAFGAASATLPDDFQLGPEWTEGAGLLLEATKHVAGGGDANQFVFEKTLDQSLSGEVTRKFISLAIAAQNPDPTFKALTASPIGVKVEPLRRSA